MNVDLALGVAQVLTQHLTSLKDKKKSEKSNGTVSTSCLMNCIRGNTLFNEESGDEAAKRCSMGWVV